MSQTKLILKLAKLKVINKIKRKINSKNYICLFKKHLTRGAFLCVPFDIILWLFIKILVYLRKFLSHKSKLTSHSYTAIIEEKVFQIVNILSKI